MIFQQKKGSTTKKNKLTLDSVDENTFNSSVSCEFTPDGVRFLRANIKVTKNGLAKINGDDILSLSIVSSEDIEFGGELGRGAAGIVQEGIYKPNNFPIAIKSMSLFDKNKRHQVMNDLKIFLQDRLDTVKGGDPEISQYLVQVYGAYYDEGSIKIIMELMDAGSLRDVMNMSKKFKKEAPFVEEVYLANIAYQVLLGLNFMHRNKKQIHRDIKPENILMNSSGNVKLTDFGVSKQLEQTTGFSKTFVGTYTYMSPERLNGEPYAFSSDMWSLGIILIELATGEYPYKQSKSFIELLQNIQSTSEPNLPENDERYSDLFRDFLRHCLNKDPMKRAKAIDLLEHKWFLVNSELGYDLSEWIKEMLYMTKKNVLNFKEGTIISEESGANTQGNGLYPITEESKSANESYTGYSNPYGSFQNTNYSTNSGFSVESSNSNYLKEETTSSIPLNILNGYINPNRSSGGSTSSKVSKSSTSTKTSKFMDLEVESYD